jgi:hypothetical protein
MVAAKTSPVTEEKLASLGRASGIPTADLDALVARLRVDDARRAA